MGTDGVTPDPLLRFALSSFMLLIMSLCQGLFRWLVWDRFVEDRVWQFVDLLAVTNISCFLMEERFYGHYLHGRSVHAHADSDMLELKMARIEAKSQRNKQYTPSATETRKCNAFADKGVQSFARFVRLLNQLLEPEPNGKGANPPAPGAWAGDHAESLGPYLRAHFHMARLLGRHLTPDPRAAVPGMTRSLDTYRFLVGYVPEVRSAISQPERFKEELHICEQMAELLPEKINQMHYNGRTMG